MSHDHEHGHSHDHEELRAKRQEPADKSKLGNSYSSVLNIWIKRHKDALTEMRRRDDLLDMVAGDDRVPEDLRERLRAEGFGQ